MVTNHGLAPRNIPETKSIWSDKSPDRTFGVRAGAEMERRWGRDAGVGAEMCRRWFRVCWRCVGGILEVVRDESEVFGR